MGTKRVGLARTQALIENLKRDIKWGAGTTQRGLVNTVLVTGVTVNTTAGDSDNIGTFTQPADTVLTNCFIFCKTAPVIGSGDIGYEIGTTSGAGEIMAAVANEILDGGTTVVVGAVTYAGAVSTALAVTNGLVAVTQNAATHVVSPQYAASARTIYCNITNTEDAGAGTQGEFVFVFQYVYVASA